MKVAVYCSSKEKLDPKYYECGKSFGKMLALNGHTLIYGGYDKGVMGCVASAAKENGGKVIGVVPEIFRDRDTCFCTETIFTKDMAERKDVMEKISDAFVCLPGGIGSMDEYFEIYTLDYLKVYNKKVCVYNFNNFYDDIKAYLVKATNEGFMDKETLDNSPFFENEEDIKEFLKDSDY